jgi:hypothetical protein
MVQPGRTYLMTNVETGKYKNELKTWTDKTEIIDVTDL